MKMVFTKKDVTEQRNYGAALRSSAFTTYNGAELCKLLDLLKEEEAFDAIYTLNAQIGSVTPNIPAIRKAIRQLVDTLERQSPSKLEELSKDRCLDANAMANWFGAKLTDLLGAFASESRVSA